MVVSVVLDVRKQLNIFLFVVFLFLSLNTLGVTVLSWISFQAFQEQNGLLLGNL